MKKLTILMVSIFALFGLFTNACQTRCEYCPHVIKTVILEGVNFAFDKADLLPSAYPILEEDVRMLKNRPELQVSIEGHCDIRGSDAYNMKLSERRADSVYKYLLSQGIAANRMKTVGYGRTRPLVPNTSEENMYKNRRVEIKIIKIGD
jgi:OOP family OmpA-OmpF porin